MTRALEFTVYGTAVPKGSTRAFVPKGWTRPIITSDNKSLRAWEQVVRGELQRVMAVADRELVMALFEAPIALSFVFYLPRPKSAPRRVTHPVTKPDLSKLIRATEDALSTVAFRDDARVVSITARKVFAQHAAKVEIRIEVVDQAGIRLGLPSGTPLALPLEEVSHG